MMDFSFVQITDHHLTVSETEYVRGFSTRYAFRTVLKDIAEKIGGRADFIVSTGDLVDQPGEASYRAVLQLLQVSHPSSAVPGPLLISAEGLRDFPLYVLPGNHDDRDRFYTCLFPGQAPMPLMNVAFIHKGIQFICLDWGPRARAVAHPETLDFLAQSLETELPAILLMHYHVTPIGARWLDGLLADNLPDFWKIVAGKPVLGIFCGHVHTTYEQVVNSIPVFGLRSTAAPFALQDEPLTCLLPPQYRLVTAQNGLLTTRVFDVPL